MTQHPIGPADRPSIFDAEIAIIANADLTGRVAARYTAGKFQGLGNLQCAGLVREDWLTDAGMAIYRDVNRLAIANAYHEAGRMNSVVDQFIACYAFSLDGNPDCRIQRDMSDAYDRCKELAWDFDQDRSAFDDLIAVASRAYRRYYTDQHIDAIRERLDRARQVDNYMATDEYHAAVAAAQAAGLFPQLSA
jgi:hypothetical protein